MAIGLDGVCSLLLRPLLVGGHSRRNDERTRAGIRWIRGWAAITITIALALVAGCGEYPTPQEGRDGSTATREADHRGSVGVQAAVWVDALPRPQDEAAAAVWVIGNMGTGLYLSLPGDESAGDPSSGSMPLLSVDGAGDGWRTLVSQYELISQFLTGYRDGVGRPEYERHLVDNVIPCESGWNNIAYQNGYVSVAQFHPDSWARAGGGDPLDLYTVGRNVANWINAISDPGGSGGWPVCWHRGGW